MGLNWVANLYYTFIRNQVNSLRSIGFVIFLFGQNNSCFLALYMIIMQSAQRVIAQSIDMVGGADFGSEYSSYSTHVGARAPSASHQGRDVGRDA